MSARVLGAFWLLCTVLASLAPGSAHAFRRFDVAFDGIMPHEPVNIYQPLIHWDLREFEDCRVPVVIGRTTNDLSPGDQSQQVLVAMHAWEAVSPAQIRFVLTGHDLAQPPSYLRDGYNTVSWNDTSIYSGDGMGSKAPIEGITYVHFDPTTGRILEADIRLNDAAFDWKVGTHNGQVLPSGQADVRTVVLHEFGHFIGLDHPRDDFLDWDMDRSPQGNFPGPEDLDHNNNGVFDVPLMQPYGGQTVRWSLHHDDRDGCNFLYNPDLGDAPDPYVSTFNEFPSKVHQYVVQTGLLNNRPRYAPAGGASHFFSIRSRQPSRNYSYEWLGFPLAPNVIADDFGSECESNQVDRDPFDDGVTLTPNPAVFRKPVDVSVWVRHANDALGNGHNYATRPLYENTWLDFNMDGVWDESERFLRRALHPGSPGGPNATAWVRVDTTIVLPDILATASRPMWLRARVDWGEDSGDATKIEPGLAGPRGAAHYGEVEDYPIRMLKPKTQLMVANGSGHASPGIAMVVPGQPGPGQNYQSHTTAGDCPTDPFANPPVQSYDGGSDETSVAFTSSLIDPGANVHVGRAQSDIPAQILRAHWMTLSGPPGIDDWIPTVNGTAFDLHGPIPGERRTRVVVGPVNTAAGGVIAGDPDLFTWSDSVFVSVTARIAPTPIALENLSLCHPLVTALTPIPLGSAWTTPQTPFVAELPEAMTSGALVLEVHNSWSVNAATSTELIEFDEVLSTTAVHEVPVISRRFALRAMPTPMAGSTTIAFTLPRLAQVSLGIYDLSGRLRRALYQDRSLAAGTTRLEWNGNSKEGRRLPAGIYFLKLDVDGERETATVVVLE